MTGLRDAVRANSAAYGAGLRDMAAGRDTPEATGASIAVAETFELVRALIEGMAGG